MTAWLSRGINFGLAGGLTQRTQLEGVTFTPLIRTSGRTMRMPAAQALARPSPYEILQNWPPDGRVETVAARLSGVLQTAYPEGAPEAAAPAAPGQSPPSPSALAPPHLLRSARPAEIVIVADTDFLADDFYIDPQNGGPAADNASFALNAIDVLGGSDALVSLRSRAPSIRRMTMIDKTYGDADHHLTRLAGLGGLMG